MATPFNKDIIEWNKKVNAHHAALKNALEKAGEKLTEPNPQLHTESLLWWIEDCVDKGNFSELKKICKLNKVDSQEWIGLIRNAKFKSIIEKLLIQAGIGMIKMSDSEAKNFHLLCRHVGLYEPKTHANKSKKNKLDKITFAPFVPKYDPPVQQNGASEK